MRGFTDKALILLSDKESFLASHTLHRTLYQQSINNLIGYLQDMEMQHYCLISDGLAGCLNMHSPKWLSTAAPEDLFFMRTYCNIPDGVSESITTEQVELLRKKYPIARGIDPLDRLKIVANRVKYMEKQIISTFQFVVVFGSLYKVRTKENDGRAVLRINDKHFYTSMELSGQALPINEFLQIPYGNVSLSEWGKYSGKT